MSPRCVSHSLGGSWALNTCGSWESALPRAEPHLQVLGLQTHLSPRSTARRSAAPVLEPGREDGRPGGTEGRGEGYGTHAGELCRLQPASEALLAAAAAKPAGLGAAPGPCFLQALSALPRASPRPAAQRRRSINNHKPPIHPPLKINNSVIRVISEAS